MPLIRGDLFFSKKWHFSFIPLARIEVEIETKPGCARSVCVSLAEQISGRYLASLTPLEGISWIGNNHLD